MHMIFYSLHSYVLLIYIDFVKNKTESIRKLSNFNNCQWTKILYQNNLKNIAFVFTFFKG